MARKQAQTPREDHGLPAQDCEPAKPVPGPPPTTTTMMMTTMTLTDGRPPPETDALPEPVPSLPEISRLLRSRDHEMRKCLRAQEELYGLQVANARTSRLVRTAPAIRRTLAECIRVEDKAGFASLFNACHDAVDECSRSLPNDLDEDPTDPAETSYLAGSFLQDLSAPARATVLECLSLLTHDGNYIANRLASLTALEINALLPDRSSGGPGDSVLGVASARSLSRTSKPLGFVVDAQADILTSQSYASPLETLVHALRDPSTAGIPDQDPLLDIWASVSAALIREHTPGGERLVPALIDIWSSMLPWPGKERLEVWIMRTVQQGATLLDNQSKRSFRARDPNRLDALGDDEARMQSFLNGAADSLMELFASPDQPSIIPPGALVLCRAIWSKLQALPDHQRVFPQFAITRWFYTFLLEVITLPEAHDMLTDFYISETVRQRILREIVNRSQKAIYDVVYSWYASRLKSAEVISDGFRKHGINPPSETIHRIQSVMSRFQGSFPAGSCKTDCPSAHAADGSSRPASVLDRFAVLSVNDARTILKALHPLRRPASIMSDRDTLRSGIYSSASSVSGFSMFRNTDRAVVVPSQTSESLRMTPPDAEGAIGMESFGTKSGHTRETDGDRSFPDHEQLREASFELDDLAANNAPSSRRFWAVLALDPRSRAFSTLLDRCGDLPREKCASINELVNRDTADAQTQCVEALQALLQRYGGQIPLEPPGELGIGKALHWARAQLSCIFEQMIEDVEGGFDFVQAHHWVCRLREFHALTDPPHKLGPLLQKMAQRAHGTVSRASALANHCGDWLRCPLPLAQLQQQYLQPFTHPNSRLRDKMWYIADVRTSAAYDEARIVTSALRTMGKPRKVQSGRVVAPLRHWTGPKPAGGNLHLKSEAQVLELLSARLEHGGPNKLSDEQSKATSTWLENQHIVNVCKGEERIHRLCMEIRKCAESIFSSSNTESPMILSDNLFARDQILSPPTASNKRQSLLPTSYGAGHASKLLSFGGSVPQRPGTSSSASQSLSAASSRDRLDARSPTLTNRSSMPFWSPAMTEIRSPSSVTSADSFQTPPRWGLDSPRSPHRATSEAPSTSEKLRQHLTSLLLSDLAANMYSQGSETDAAFWTGIGGDLSTNHFRSKTRPPIPSRSTTTTTGDTDCLRSTSPIFDFRSAFEKLFAKFSATLNPFQKLGILFQIENLLGPMLEQTATGDPSHSSLAPTSPAGASTQQKPDFGRPLVNHESVRGFIALFCESSLRPSSIFRDLQYIASLVPLSTLEGTRTGGAFCSAVFAITQLKQEVRGVIVGTVDNIIAYYSDNRGGGRSPSAAQQQRDSATFSPANQVHPAKDVARYTMADAAHLLKICAREGEPAAQRELATLYVTNPSDVGDRILEPFARPYDVFKEELESKWRKNQDPDRCDPWMMCVAHHWMILSSKGGDALAEKILRQQDEMDKLP